MNTISAEEKITTHELAQINQSQTPSNLVKNLLAIKDSTSQKLFLSTNIPNLSRQQQDKVADLLKEKSDLFLRSDIKKCLNVADLLFYLFDLTRNPRHQALGLSVKANAYGYGGLGNYQEAVDLYEEARKIYVQLDNPIYQAVVQYAKLVPLANLGHYKEAFEIGKQTGEVFEKNEEWLWLAKLNVNLGVIYYRLGEDINSLKHYNRARAIYNQIPGKREAQLALIRVEKNRGDVLRNLGRFEESIEAIKTTGKLLEESGQIIEAARAKQNLAVTYFVLGKYNEALQLLDQAQTVFINDGRNRDAVLTELYISDCLLQLRRFRTVLEKSKEANSLFSELGTRFEIAQSLLNEAVAYAGLRQFNEALLALEKARDMFIAEGNAVWVASTDLEMSAILRFQGQNESSLQKALSCAIVFKEYNLPVEQSQANLSAARAALEINKYEQAKQLAQKALIVANKRNLSTLKYQSHFILGSLWIQLGEQLKAKDSYEQAALALENLRGRMMVEHRFDFLEDKEVVYQDLVHLCLEINQPHEGLLYAERAKSRALLDLLAFRLDLGLEAKDEADQPIVEKLIELRAERDRLYRRWQGNEAIVERGTLIPIDKQTLAQEDVLNLENQITQLWHKLLVRNADYAREASLWQIRTESIQPYLDNETILVEYFVTNGQLVTFLVTRESVSAIQLSAELTTIQHLLQLFWLNLRAVPKSSPQRLSQLTINAHGILNHLYNHLIAPFSNEISHFKRLMFVPHGSLHYCPFHALMDVESPLLDSHVVSYLPSASFLRHCRDAPRANGGVLAVGQSYNGQLPFTIQEAQKIATANDGVLLLENNATLARVKESISNFRAIHFAAHGDFRPDNPLFSGLALNDGWLTTLDIFSLRLRASLVTLSACQTGRNVVGGGDELLGLMRAFLSAGAASLVLSQWAVEDQSTSLLMEIFYQKLTQGWYKSAALRFAQQQIRQSNLEHINKYRHPYFWAPFYLVGDDTPL